MYVFTKKLRRIDVTKKCCRDQSKKLAVYDGCTHILLSLLGIKEGIKWEIKDCWQNV